MSQLQTQPAAPATSALLACVLVLSSGATLAQQPAPQPAPSQQTTPAAAPAQAPAQPPSNQPASPAPASKPSLPSLTPEQQADLLTIHHRYLDAITAYKQISPQTAVTQNKLGIAYEHMFMTKEAKASYEEALKLKPNFPEALNNLATVYFGEQNYSQAEKLYKKAIKLDPHSASAYHNLGTLYFANKKYPKGAHAYQQAFMLNPTVFDTNDGIPERTSPHDLAAVNYSLAKTYAQAGMKTQAIQYLRRAFGEGFKDGKHVRDQKEFAGLRDTPEFQRLMDEEGIH